MRVLDLSERLSGAYSARLMGDFGADVLLVEPASGHELRREPPFVGGNPSAERSLLHGMVNWNKRSLVHDMEADAAAVAELRRQLYHLEQVAPQLLPLRVGGIRLDRRLAPLARHPTPAVPLSKPEPVPGLGFD